MQAQTLSTVTVDLPITLDEVKQHLVVEHADDDALIMRYIVAALDYAEAKTELSLRVRRYRVFGRCWPAGGVILPYGPVRQIQTVRYLDSDNAEQTIPTDDFDVYENLGNAVVDFHITPPSVGSTRRDAVAVEYLAGYGSITGITVNQYGFPYTLPIVLGQGGSLEAGSGTTLPNSLRHGIFMLIGHWYENRETIVVGTSSSKMAHAADSLFHSMRVCGT